ncbi:MAG: hypothetical protein NVS3B25_35620 [Hymenobacter sp.]
MCHDERRGSEAAADVGDRAAGLEFRDDASEGRDPLRREMGDVARLEEARRAADE